MQLQSNNRLSVQYNPDGSLCHFLTTEGLPRELIDKILATANSFLSVGQREIKKVPLLRGKTVVNLFFESSTRTRTTFELAAMRLSADVVNLDGQRLSTKKGETLIDTLRTLEAMHTDYFVIRDSASGTAFLMAQHAPAGTHIINAGDGRHAHPTQALLDILTIQQSKPDFANLSVAIVGDILHSRVARSLIHALRAMEVEDIRVIAPKTLMPTEIEQLGVRPHHNMRDGLRGVDVVNMLRLQLERMEGSLLPSGEEYYACYGLDEERLAYAKPDAIVMHPGPINRGLEISSAVADSNRSHILKQIPNGIAIRMSIMAMLFQQSRMDEA